MTAPFFSTLNLAPPAVPVPSTRAW